MLKVFLVEDESTIRENIRKSIPWEEYGFEFAGEASDGEAALPLIRKTHPDLLITDIRMPFMDGLTLCHILKKEMPDMKKIVMSGYDDFEYARRAISEGVDQYLSKPVTRSKLRSTLEEARQQIEAGREQRRYQEQYRLESREYEELQRRSFFEQFFSGRLDVGRVYDEAGKLNLDLDDECYNLVLFSLTPENRSETEEFQIAEDEIMLFFLRYPSSIVTRLSPNACCAVIRGTKEEVQTLGKRALEQIQKAASAAGPSLGWAAVLGEPVYRFSELRTCFVKANHIFSLRFWNTGRHIFTEEDARQFFSDNAGGLDRVDLSQVGMGVIKSFLQEGSRDDIPEFTSGYLENLGESLNSKIFRSYIILNLRFAVLDYLHKTYGESEKELTSVLDQSFPNLDLRKEDVEGYCRKILSIAFDHIEEQNASAGSRIIKDALAILDKECQNPELSLNSLASRVNVSANYLSSLFPKETGKTFVEYLTDKRMNLALSLLKDPSLSTSDIAAETGYRDPHYFSFVFRKTFGRSVREYRNEGQKSS